MWWPTPRGFFLPITSLCKVLSTFTKWAVASHHQGHIPFASPMRLVAIDWQSWDNGCFLAALWCVERNHNWASIQRAWLLVLWQRCCCSIYISFWPWGWIWTLLPMSSPTWPAAGLALVVSGIIGTWLHFLRLQLPQHWPTDSPLPCHLCEPQEG